MAGSYNLNSESSTLNGESQTLKGGGRHQLLYTKIIQFLYSRVGRWQSLGLRWVGGVGKATLNLAALGFLKWRVLFGTHPTTLERKEPMPTTLVSPYRQMQSWKVNLNLSALAVLQRQP